MNLSTPVRRFQATLLSRGDRWTPTRSGGARPSCHVSYYRCVLILPTTVSACGLQMSCGGSKARLFPIMHCPLNTGVLSFLGVKKIMGPQRKTPSRKKTRSLPKPDKMQFKKKSYCGHPAARSNFEAFQIRGGNLGNSHPFRCMCCNSREEITYCNTEGYTNTTPGTPLAY
jgi:hypothetical protein